MTAIWQTCRAAVRRRKLQTIVIGIVVLLSTTTLVVALGLLAAATGPFDQAFAGQRGAHIEATYDTNTASQSQISETAHLAGVKATAGPYVVATLRTDGDTFLPPLVTVVGRGTPDSAVDRLNLWSGRWASAPGEIVLDAAPGSVTPDLIGRTVNVTGSGSLKVVGFAYSVTQTADAWVTPDQAAALQPRGAQMLYRFDHAGTQSDIKHDIATLTAAVPPNSLDTTQSYLAVKAAAVAGPAALAPFLIVFAVLGVLVAVLIVVNVISGAVVAGFRHIGVLKALGFTPAQITTIYILMVLVPAAIGCVLGVALGNVLAIPLLSEAFEKFGSSSVGLAPWVTIVCLLGMPALVALTATVPAMRARSVSAVRALSAGSPQRVGRSLRLQRWLSGTRLPRHVSLGLGTPFARPARSALTMAAVVLGVATVTFGIGLSASLAKFQDGDPGHHASATLVQLAPGFAPAGQTAPSLDDAGIEAALRSMPGAKDVIAEGDSPVSVIGEKDTAMLSSQRGDPSKLGYTIVRGRWYSGSGEIVVTSKFLHHNGLAVGDVVTLQSRSTAVHVKVVGETMTGGPQQFFGDWTLQQQLDPAVVPNQYAVVLQNGVDGSAFATAAQAKVSGLYADGQPDGSSFNLVVVSFSILLTLMLSLVAALGVFNTVVLNTREQRRNLGMLKSIGMTPRQVIIMVVTSMALLGAVGGVLGVPIGVLAHRLILPMTGNAAGVDLPGTIGDVWSIPILAALVAAGVVIAAVGALLPARSAARLTIASVLHNE